MSRAPQKPPSPPGTAVRGGSDAPFRLRLAVSRHGVGLELDGPAQLGPLRLDELAWALPSVRLPADLSGGVSAFRHRRGRMLRASLSGSAEEISRWAQLRLSEAALLGRAQRPALSLLPAEGGLGLCLASEEQALAWDLVWMPLGRDLRLIVHNARGLGLELPAHALALQASAALVREVTVTRRGSTFTLNDPVSGFLRHVLPWVGARAPGTDELVWAALEPGARWSTKASARGLEPALPAGAALAFEVALLLAEADDALAEGQWEGARQGYLRALERAPLQREVAARLADIDRSLERRADVAFGTLADAGALGGASCLEGELRRACGDREGAGVVLEAAAVSEPHAALAALAFAAAAELAESDGRAAELLAAAVARAPTHLGVRSQRLARSLRSGDRRAAIAEAERLVAATEPAARHNRLLEVGRAFAAAGQGDEAVSFFEQALRQRPEAPEALWALGQALAERGQAARAVELLGRALEGAARAGLPLHGAEIALARALAEGLGELSTAVARLRDVPAGVEASAEARWLEGHFLARLGERAEASHAFDRLRDEIARAAPEGPGARERVDSWLAWADEFEASAWSESASEPPLEAEPEGEHGSVGNVDVEEDTHAGEEAYEAEAPEGGEEAYEAEAPAGGEAVYEGGSRRGTELDAMDDEGWSQAAVPRPAAALPRVDEEMLTARVRANPEDLDAVAQLATLFEASDRDAELFALLSARIDEGDERTRQALAPRQRAVLERLAREARAAGRATEAELYELSLGALGA